MGGGESAKDDEGDLEQLDLGYKGRWKGILVEGGRGQDSTVQYSTEVASVFSSRIIDWAGLAKVAWGKDQVGARFLPFRLSPFPICLSPQIR